MLRLEVYVPPNGESLIAWSHDACFSVQCHPAVGPDDPREHGRIPAGVRCVFCGESLPVFGRHPFVFDVDERSPPRRSWSHAECMEQRIEDVLR